MAYSATVTHTRPAPNKLVVTITETDVAAASETALTDSSSGATMPPVCSLVRQSAALTSGSGSTIDPVVGTITNPASRVDKIVAQNDTAAAAVNNVPVVAVPVYVSTGLWYHRSVPDSGTDNAVTTEYLFIVDEW